jgi:predicted branched-subunit amino acid permease
MSCLHKSRSPQPLGVGGVTMVQTIFMEAFELSILYMLITAVLILAGSVTFAIFDSETKKYYIKTERSRKNA